jgi:hypothetical protein
LYNDNGSFDGRRFFYFLTDDGSDDGLFRYDFASEKNEILDVWWEYINNSNVKACGLQYYIDKKNRREYLYDFTTTKINVNYNSTYTPYSSKANAIRRYNLESGVIETGFSGPPWADAGGSYYDYSSTKGPLVWDGNETIYKIRGTSESGLTTEWAKYHVPSDTWVNLSSICPMPSAPSRAGCLVWLDKATSGFSNHRLYFVSDTHHVLYYVEINENNRMPIGTWTSAGSLPGPSGGSSNKLFHKRSNRWYFYASANSSKALYYSSIDSGSLTWTLIDNNYLTETNLYNAVFLYCNTPASRVRTSIIDRTKYWFIGTGDSIVVATKSDGKYSFCFAGSLEQASSKVPQAKITQTIYPGTNVEIPINLLKGEFYTGQKMTIVNTNEGAGNTIIDPVENITRSFMPCETFTITNVVYGQSITADRISHVYSAGARIAYDPQPIGITLDGLDRIQMLNCVNTIDQSGSFDMAENIFQLQTVQEAIVNASGNDSRKGEFKIWPIMSVHMDNDASFSGTEARGSLNGIYAVSGSASLNSEDLIKVGGKTYIILSVPTAKSFLYALGPIDE